MATIDQLISRGKVIRDETKEEANTANRVGSWDVDMAQYVKDNKPTKASLTDVIGLASETETGLMSKEQVTELKELEDMFKTDDDNYDFIFTAFTVTDATPIHIGSHSIHYNIAGSARYKVKSKNSSYESVARNANLFVSLITSAENDIVKLCVSDVYRVKINPSNLIRVLQVSSKNQIRLDQLDISGTGFEYLDLSGMYSVGWLKASNCALTHLGTLSVIMLPRIDLSNSKKLQILNVWGRSLKTLNTANCSVLSDLYFDADLPNLQDIDISGTALRLDFITTLASRWDSRSGKDTGVLRLDTALYNQMSSDLRTTYTDKNITFDIK